MRSHKRCRIAGSWTNLVFSLVPSQSCAFFLVALAFTAYGLDYEYKAINLFKREQHNPEFLKINPMGYVPALVDGDIVLADSLAIILVSNFSDRLSIICFYLEEKYPQHPLLPHNLEKRAINYQQYVEENVGPDAKIPWILKHVGKGFAALDKLLKDHAGKYATGDEIFLADLFLAPHIIAMSQRYNYDMTEFPLLSRLSEAYKQVPAIQDAMPEKQPDFQIN
ncbi:Glutathione S-transferase/chloride channel, C-terminal [Cynara cardunculus var. scolymus]|uniref:Glutathione S-transferase/chloride channel, C-terminal n=1 Tax=Cynara cardunculus var. scolymus TaxID=59895 RepID=A0A103YLR5_CYNCS|nr:Glutathione S-transferase/chloride channel, C-terminal [Cynara cardunculus var. scolymus]